METRRVSRTDFSTGRRVHSRSSPPRRASPSKSTGRKSPSRKSEKPATITARSDKPPEMDRRRKESKKAVVTDKVDAAVTAPSLPITMKRSPASTTSTKLITTTTTNMTSIKISNISNQDDDEVARISDMRLKQAFAKMTPTVSIHNRTPTVSSLNRSTPTPSGQSRHSASRHSASRSLSRSFMDEEKHSDYSDNEIEPRCIKKYAYPCGSYDGTADDDNYKYVDTTLSDSWSYLSRRDVQLKMSQEFGGNIGALFSILLLSLAGFMPVFMHCPLFCKSNVNWERLYDIKTYLNLQAVASFFGFTLSMYVLSIIKIGRIVTLKNDRDLTEYCFNCIFLSICSFIIMGTFHYYNYNVTDFIYDHYGQFAVIGIINALILSILCYIRSKFAPPISLNPYAKSGKFLSDLFIGRELNPKWFNLIDIKLLHYRISLITTLIYIGMLFEKTCSFAPVPAEGFEQSNLIYSLYERFCYDSLTTFICVLMLIYILDLIIHEHHLSSSFEVQSEGVGTLLLLRYAIFPYINLAYAKYLMDCAEKHEMPLWTKYLTAFIFLLGIYIKRGSLRIKYKYRLNPLQPKMLQLETLPTFQGKRLLVCKMWNFVRHPNYLGDIISMLSMLIPFYFNYDTLTFILLIFNIIFLFHRAYRVNNRNLNRYNSAWKRYCTRVPYMIIPKIY